VVATFKEPALIRRQVALANISATKTRMLLCPDGFGHACMSRALGKQQALKPGPGYRALEQILKGLETES
jgi:hypothetical protein